MNIYQEAKTTTDLKLQTQLVNDSDSWVRENLAANTNLLSELQKQLANDSSRMVRGNLAKNPSLLPELQPQLANDSESWVRRSLAVNTNLLPEILRILFPEFQLAILSHIRKNQFRYLNPKTQELLETSLLLK